MKGLEADLTVVVGAGSQRYSVEASLRIEQGVLVLFGPSGSGKTLTLRALAGLVVPERGRIAIGSTMLYESASKVDVPAENRKIGYVPQESALFPFLDVERNVSFALPSKDRKRGNTEILILLEELGIVHLKGRSPSGLSGGEKQRVALARALAAKPRLLILDEPMASIDLEGQKELLKMVRRVVDARQIPMVLVTHETRHALAIGDSVVRFERVGVANGRTGEAGRPREVLEGLEVLD